MQTAAENNKSFLSGADGQFARREGERGQRETSPAPLLGLLSGPPVTDIGLEGWWGPKPRAERRRGRRDNHTKAKPDAI